MNRCRQRDAKTIVRFMRLKLSKLISMTPCGGCSLSYKNYSTGNPTDSVSLLKLAREQM